LRFSGVLSEFDAIFHPVAGAFDYDGFGVVEQTDGNGQKALGN
jgi:hypothetical protein